MRKRLVAAGLSLCLLGCVFSASSAAPPKAKTAQEVTAAKEEARDEFVLGNIVFVLFHEFGHALVSEFDLPVLGREENAVDRFATFLLTPEGDENEDEDPSTILVDAMRGWFAASEQTEFAELDWWDEHGPDRQRAYQIACLLYGVDPKKFSAMADEIELPEARRESCPAEATSNSKSWLKVAEPHALDEGEKPRKRIAVTYGSGGKYRSERDLLKGSELLGGIASQITETFRLPRNLTIVAKQCGESNAYWDKDAGEIQVCYELVREYRELFAEAGS